MRCRKVFLFFLMIFLVLTGLSVWTAAAERQAHYMPDYEKEDLAPLLKLEGWELSEEDYRLIFLQTGLAKAGVIELYEAGRQRQLLGLQERFFAEVKVECRHVNPLLRSERLVGMQCEAFLPAVQDGDILVTFSGHVFGWRSGHAAVVVNASEGQTLEAVTYGYNSAVCSVEHWREYPCFALLRLKGVTGVQQAEIAEYAMAEFVDVPYSLFAFTDFATETAENMENPKGMGHVTGHIRGLSEEPSAEAETDEGSGLASTQCAHLVWAVYRHFGYDLDSDGGAVVTPADIFDSDLLEVVQVYGINPENITNF